MVSFGKFRDFHKSSRDNCLFFFHNLRYFSFYRITSCPKMSFLITTKTSLEAAWQDMETCWKKNYEKSTRLNFFLPFSGLKIVGSRRTVKILFGWIVRFLQDSNFLKDQNPQHIACGQFLLQQIVAAICFMINGLTKTCNTLPQKNCCVKNCPRALLR